jgi:uncharacterized membrane protein
MAETRDSGARDSGDMDMGAVVGRALGIGVVAGLRSATAPAVLARAHARGVISLPEGGLLGLLADRRLARLLPLQMVGEMIVDKLPFVPSRLASGPLGGRLVIGALTGAAVTRGSGQGRLPGALLGAAGALAGAFGGNRARAAAVRATSLPDPAVALVEDAVAAGGGYALLRRPVLGMALFGLAMAAALGFASGTEPPAKGASA